MTSNQPPTSSKELDRKKFKTYLDKLHAYDQAGGYVPLELADDDFASLCNHVEALITKATEALLDKAVKELPKSIDNTTSIDGASGDWIMHGYNAALKDVRTRLTTLRKEG